MSLDLDQLRTLLAFADTGSVKNAARVVRRTPSAVSTHLSKLSTSIGRPLLQRRGRGLELTPDGAEVVKIARRMVGLEHELLARFDASAFAGTLRVGLPDDYVPTLMSPLFDALGAVAPQARLEVQCAPSAELRPLIANADLDLAVLSEPAGSGAGVLLRREEVVWASARHETALADGAIPLALFPTGCIVRAAALADLSTLGIATDIVCESRSMSAVQAAIRARLAIAPIARSCMPEGAEIMGAGSGLPRQRPIDIVLAASATAPRSLTAALVARLRERLG
ncbi:LysR family transcriptional regulator [Leucobacter sp. gxy201]|uniref:LysR family transcriptional regulator n=1 Tax=Leucobacter sp. gxy201 TaxID=2957200 RepID=UPI003DA02297